MPIAKRLTMHHQRLPEQRLSGGEVTLLQQQHTEKAGGGERVRVSAAVRLACHIQRLPEQRLGLAKYLQRRSERTQGEACALPMRPLGLEPCTENLEAQPITVLVHALAAAVGCVPIWARAPPLLEAVLVDPLGGATAGARLHEPAIVFIPPAQPARLLLHYRCLVVRGRLRRGVQGLEERCEQALENLAGCEGHAHTPFLLVLASGGPSHLAFLISVHGLPGGAQPLDLPSEEDRLAHRVAARQRCCIHRTSGAPPERGRALHPAVVLLLLAGRLLFIEHGRVVGLEPGVQRAKRFAFSWARPVGDVLARRDDTIPFMS
eukprot:scaffold122668_cov63-Phaeocystis_antarctica.AAC.1